MIDKSTNSVNNTSSWQKNKLSDQSEVILQILTDRGLMEDDKISNKDIRQALMAKKRP